MKVHVVFSLNVIGSFADDIIHVVSILGDPGAVSRAGRKGATKVFKHRWKNPWVPTLTGPKSSPANLIYRYATTN